MYSQKYKFVAILLCVFTLMTNLNLNSIINNNFNATNNSINTSEISETDTLITEESIENSTSQITTESTESLVEMEDTEIIQVSAETEDDTSTEITETTEEIAVFETKSISEISDAMGEIYADIDLDSTKTFTTKTLLVISDTLEFDTYGAISIINYDNLYVLSYESENDTEYAYDALKQSTSILSVEVDTVIETNTVNTKVLEETDSVEFNTSLNEFILENETNNEVKLAILDTGINPAETVFNNRIIDLNSNLSSSGDTNSILDDNGHGTDIAMLIASNTNKNVKLMPIKIANTEGKATILSTYLGTQKAIENDADIINISLGTISSSSSMVLTNIIDKAVNQGIIVVVSAGNDNSNVRNYSPANIESAITVSAVDTDGNMTNFSNYGALIDYCSYGETGTSIATANVSSIVALIKSIYPDYTSNDVTSLLNKYVIDLGDDGFDEYYGNGLLALTVTNSLIPSKTATSKESSSILDCENWQEITDEEFNNLLFHSEQFEVGKFLTELNDTEFELALEKSEYLNNETIISNFDEDVNTISETTIVCYQDCINEYNLYQKDLEVFGYGNPSSTSAKFTAASASIFVCISSTDNRIYSENKVVIRGEKTSTYGTGTPLGKYTVWLNGGSALTGLTMKTTASNTGGSSVGFSASNASSFGIYLTGDEKDSYTKGSYCRQAGVQFTVSYTKPTGYTLDSVLNDYPCATFGGLLTNGKATANGKTVQLWKYGSNSDTAKDTGSDNTNSATKFNASSPTINIVGDLQACISEEYGYQYIYYKPIQYLQNVQVRYQNADGTWGNYSSVINANYDYATTVSWSRATDATYKAASISYTVTGTATKYVDVYRNTCTVALTKGTGIASVTGAGTYYYGQSATINATLLTGYHWVNWTGSTTYTNMSNSFTVNGNKSFTANAAINISTLTINPNGGSWNSNTNTQSFTQNYNTTKSIPVPTRTGYTFTGWTRANTYGSISSLTNAATYTYGATNGVTDTLTARWTPINYTVTCIDKVENTSGITLGTSTWSAVYGSTANGATKGTSTTIGAYYKGYYYTSSTTATVGTSGATVYRFFKLATIEQKATINWNDNDNLYSSRPKSIVLKVMNGNTVVKTATVTVNNAKPATTNSLTYIFTGLQKYDTSTGKEIVYTLVEEQPVSLNSALKYDVTYSADTWTVTNITIPPEKPNKEETWGVTIKGNITWVDENNKYHFRPDSVIVELYQNGKLHDSQTVTSSYVFTGLDMIDANLNEYKYTIVEKTIDNYEIAYDIYDKQTSETDTTGNIIITTTKHCDITNTFKPDNSTIRFGDNQLTIKTTFLNEKDEVANETDFKRLLLDRENQSTFVCLKQMVMNWNVVDAGNGKYLEEYGDAYSGNKINLILTGTDTIEVSDIPYGKYEIVVSDDNNFKFKNIEELSTKNVKFSTENNRYYLTYSYEYEETKEDLNVNMTLDTWRGYSSDIDIKNFFKPKI